MLFVYSKSNCPECVKCMDYLDGLGLAYEAIKVDEIPEMRARLIAAGHRSVPQVYYDNEHIGGYSKIVSLGIDGIKKITS